MYNFVAIFHIPNYLGSQRRNRQIPQRRVSSDLMGHTCEVGLSPGKAKIIILSSSNNLKNKSKKSYPGPRGFSCFFFAKEINGKPRSGDNESQKRRGEREKNLWIPWPRISLSCRRQGQDLTFGRWLVDSFSNTQTNFIGSFNCNYRGDAEDFHTSFCISLLGKKIVCMLPSQ